MKNSKKIDLQVIQRRIEFLLNEVKSPNPQYDKSISMVMRLISNYTTVGIDLDSKGVKRINKNTTKKSEELRSKLHFDEFHKLTTNEHHFPLKDLWNWMIENQKELTVQKVLDKFHEYPFITVTNEENSLLNKLKKQKLSPEDRYRLSNIEIIHRSQDENGSF